MNMEVSESVKDMKSETVDALQELVRGLHDSFDYLTQAADKIETDAFPASRMRAIADDRRQICESIGDYISIAGKEPAEDGTWLGSLRKTWTSFRAGLNAGDAKVVLIEAERAEDVIKAKFEEILKETVGNPINDKLLQQYERVKQGHDSIRDMRDQYQAG